MSSTRTRTAVLTLLIASCIAACSTPGTRLGAALDDAAELLEEFGTVSVSAPVLSLPDERFAFDLSTGGADEHFRAARADVEGGSATLRQYARAAGLRVDARLDQIALDEFARALESRAEQRIRGRNVRRRRRAEARERYEAALTTADHEEDDTDRAEARQAALDDYHAQLREIDERESSPTQASGGSGEPAVDAPDEPTEAEAEAEAAFASAERLRDVLAHKSFAAAGTLLDGLDGKTLQRNALITAAGDNAVEAVLRVFGRPDQAQSFRGHPVLFGISTLAVNPGWRTRSDFAGAVDVKVGVVWHPARPSVADEMQRRLESGEESAKDAATKRHVRAEFVLPPRLRPFVVGDGRKAESVGEESAPPPPAPAGSEDAWADARKRSGLPISLVVPVAPLNEARNLSLSSSERRRLEEALEAILSAVAPGQRAAIAADWRRVRDLQRDAVTRSHDVTINSYSKGSLFGFEAGPIFRADVDPSDDEAQPGYRLRRSTSPVLLVIGLPTHVGPYLLNVDGKQTWFEPHLRFTQAPRWGRTTPRKLSDHIVPRRRHSMEELVAAIEEIHRQAGAVASDDTVIRGLTEARIDFVHQHVAGTFHDVPVPLSALQGIDVPELTIEATSPLRLDIDGEDVAAAKADKAKRPPEATVWMIAPGVTPNQVTGVDVIHPRRGVKALDYTVHGNAIATRLALSTTKGSVVLGVRLRRHAGVMVSAPIELRAEAKKATPKPEIAQAVPQTLPRLPRDAKGDPVPRHVLLRLIGSKLDRIELQSVHVANGRAEVTSRARGGKPTARLHHGVLEVELRLDGDSVPLVLSFHARDDKSKEPYYSPPITFTRSSGERAFVEFHSGRRGWRLESSPGADPELVEAISDVVPSSETK